MYVVPVLVAKSQIDGRGVFTAANIEKGTVVWVFKKGHDIALSPHEFDLLSEEKKNNLYKSAYLSPWSGLWIHPPTNDPAEFTNHSPLNNLSVVFESSVSTEPYFVANRNIIAGEELTNNYHEFDKLTQQAKPSWAK